MDALVVNLFGETRVCPPVNTTAGRRAAFEPPKASARPPRKVADLLGFLLCGGQRRYERAVLSDHFWGDQEDERARRCLSTTIWRLRQLLEPEGVARGTYLSLAGPETLGFNWASKHCVDVLNMEAVLDRVLSVPPQRMTREDARGLEDGLELYTGDFLSGAQDFWALRERERLASRHLDGLSHLMRYKLHTGRYQSGLNLGARILESDPLREDVHRDMMRLNVRMGQRSRAIHQYHECRALLRRELQIDPAPETEEAYQTLCQGGVPDLEHDSGAVTPEMAEQALDRLRRALEEVDRARALVERLTRSTH